MAEEGKKITFGFTKTIKKPALKNVALPKEKTVDYIEFVDDKMIKIKGSEEKKDVPLVIPMLGSKTWHNRIVNKTDADIFEPKSTEPKIKDEPMQDIQIKQEKINPASNEDIQNDNNAQSMEVTEIKNEPEEEQLLTLEEQAAREIIADLNTDDKDKEQKQFTVPITNEDDLQGKEESTLEDYENIPIDAFGLAMLRGMGWQPGKGIGKNEKVIPPAIPELRPKGMGLGVDKLVSKNIKNKSSKENETLQLVKGNYVKIIAGQCNGSYAKVEGFDEDAARIFLKLALGGEVITVNEFWVQPVTSTEYDLNSKVLNIKRYEEYKSTEVEKNDKPKREPSKHESSSDDKGHKSKRREKSKKKSKKRRNRSSGEESEEERKPRRKRESSNSSDEDQTQKKSKKSKKHKNRDSSSERSSRENRNKDKEREKTRHKQNDYSDPSERARHKSHKRSRSRSSPKSRRRGRSRS